MNYYLNGMARNPRWCLVLLGGLALGAALVTGEPSLASNHPAPHAPKDHHAAPTQLRIEVPTRVLPVGGAIRLKVSGVYPGGSVRKVDPRKVRWTVSPASMATIEKGSLHVRRAGHFRVRAHVDHVHSAWTKLEAAAH